MSNTVLVLSILGSYVVSLTATIPPDYALQDVDYLCNGSLKSNTTVVLDGGEHRISTMCTISNIDNVTIMGSSINSTTIRCEGTGLQFVSVQQLTMERVTFVTCGIILTSTENTLIKTCIFQNNVGSAVKLDASTGNVSLTNCTFQNNSATYYDGGAVWLDGSKGNINITNCTFQDNSAKYSGGAVWLNGPTGYVSIANCIFQNNSATYGGGGGVVLSESAGYVSITNCIFQNNSATKGGGGAITLYESAGNVSITNCKFENNSVITPYYIVATYGGGAVWFGGNQYRGNVSITNSTFQSNSATYGVGGAVWLGGSTGNVSITNCAFQNNSAVYDGGAIYIGSNKLVIINKSTFVNNSAVRGAAVYASYIYDVIVPYNSTGQQGHLILREVVVENNHCSCNGYQKFRGGAIYFSGMKVDIIGDTITGSQFLSNSPMGAITGENGLLQLHGNVSFYNNIGENGGAISLSNNVTLYFYNKSRVLFCRNVAKEFGGAIYNDGSQIAERVTTCTSNCIISFIADPKSTSITFTGNHAQQGGHAVYATPIYDCFCRKASSCCKNLNSYFTITPLPQDLNDTQVLSFPMYVQLCNCSDSNVCNAISQYEGKITTYPGRTVRLNVTPVDVGKNLSPSVVYTSIGTNGDITTTITLGPRQEAQWIGTVCGTIEYQIYGPENDSLRLVLSTYPGSSPTIIEVELLPCKPEFTFVPNSSKCDCWLFYTKYGVGCDALDGTVTRNKNNWIGVYNINDTNPALASFCPLGYCNSTIRILSQHRLGDLCSGGRTGILCGKCNSNYSVIFGSSQCQVCSDMWLFTLVMFAVLGALLVAALFFLNLTVTQGTLYGLIFYANIIQVNTSIFFSQSTLRPLQVIVSLLNLDLGIPMCFYHGMDDADKAGLQFVFPAYLLILTMTVIVLCHFCLQQSPTTSTRSCVYRVSNIIGERAVGVLSTLIYLSYSKLFRTVIDVFTYSTVHQISDETSITMNVWFYDGNVKYLCKKHIVMFVAAMVTFILFLLPYTFVITFIPIIEHYSEYNRLFNYLHKKANQIKPMIDAHYAPYKGEWRWWLGARLWLLVVMYSLNPVLSSDNPSLLLSIQATVVILFMLVQAKIEPFGQSLQMSAKCKQHTNFYNQFYNSLDLFYLLNYIVLALSMSYILDQSSDQTQPIVVCVGVLVGLYVVVVMVTVLYHLIVAILKACGIFDRAREKIDGLFQRKCEVVVPATNTVSTTSFAVNFDLREPLLSDE